MRLRNTLLAVWDDADGKVRVKGSSANTKLAVLRY